MSIPLREVGWRGDEELPELPHQIWEPLPARMLARTFAVHTFPPIEGHRLDGRRLLGPEGMQYVLHPGDTRDTVLLIDADDDLGCFGLVGSGGANLACAGCRSKVGFRIDDCGTWQQTLFGADAVRRIEAEVEAEVPTEIRYPQVDFNLVDRARWRHGDPVRDFRYTEIAGPGVERWFGESAWREEVERARRDADEQA